MRLDADYLKSNCDSYFNITVRDEVTSTNDIVKLLAKEGAGEGTVLIAKSQTAGRGRMTRSFYSPKGSGVYTSLLLRPDLSIAASSRITACAAVAVRRAIMKFTDEPVYIKWVNDLYMRDRKVCGILTESSIDIKKNRLNYAVVGIGLNITAPENDFPEEIKDTAGSVYLCDVSDEIANRLVLEILNQLKEIIGKIVDRQIEQEYRASSWLDGKAVEVIVGEKVFPANVIGVADDFQLEVKTDSGEIKMFSFGEVSVKVK